MVLCSVVASRGTTWRFVSVLANSDGDELRTDILLTKDYCIESVSCIFKDSVRRPQRGGSSTMDWNSVDEDLVGVCYIDAHRFA
jgi:hypothetical protein